MDLTWQNLGIAVTVLGTFFVAAGRGWTWGQQLMDWSQKRREARVRADIAELHSLFRTHAESDLEQFAKVHARIDDMDRRQDRVRTEIQRQQDVILANQLEAAEKQDDRHTENTQRMDRMYDLLVKVVKQ